MIDENIISEKAARLAVILEELDVDMRGIICIEDIAGGNLAKSAHKLLPNAQSIVVFGMEIYPEFVDLAAKSQVAGDFRMNNLLDRHKDYLRGKLTGAAYEIARASRREGLVALPISGDGPAVDSRFLESIISFKEAGEAAGLGQIGMSGLLITRQFGPRVLLNICLTEAQLASTAREDTKACRYCNVCVYKCPAKAIGYPNKEKGERFSINRYACNQYVSSAGGCSECIRVCPVASPKYNS